MQAPPGFFFKFIFQLKEKYAIVRATAPTARYQISGLFLISLTVAGLVECDSPGPRLQG